MLSREKAEELYATDTNAWIIARAQAFRRPRGSGIEKLVDRVKTGLGLGGDDGRKAIDEEIVVSAPGKVILFGEHAVVHGVVSDPSVLIYQSEHIVVPNATR